MDVQYMGENEIFELIAPLVENQYRTGHGRFHIPFSGSAACFFNVPRRIRARKGSCQTAIRLF